MKRQILILSFILIILILSISVSDAQSGAWISQTIFGNPAGNALVDCGETCAGVTWQNSQFVYFFDINSSQWTQVDLGTHRTFHHLFAKGNVVIAFADSLVIGYSAVLSEWDTLHYEGTPLNPGFVGSARSYGCGENLAYFVTDTHFYIFDAQLGSWQADAYTLPPGYSTGLGYFWSRDDYAAVILPGTSQNKFLDMAYSLPAHDFAQLAEGVNYDDPNWQMTHGFAATWNNQLFTGYSAITNQFSVISHGGYGGDAYFHDQFSENTVYAFYYNEVISSHHARLHMLGYDTRLGYWTEDTLGFDPAYIDIGPGHQLLCGGQVAFADGTNNTVPSSPSSIYLIFSGLSGQWTIQTPGIHGSSFDPGGNLVAYFDSTSLWFYSIEQNKPIIIPLSNETVANNYSGDNFYILSFNKLQSPDSMETIFYNGSKDSWKRKTMWNAMWLKGSPQMCLFRTGGTNHEIYFYSGLVDDYVAQAFPADPYSIANLHANGNIGATSGTDFFGIYDATNNTVHTEDYYMGNYDGLGSSAAVFTKDSHTLKVYSMVTHQWSEFAIAEDINYVSAQEFIGLIEIWGNNKFYAFNGYYSNLVPLEPAGSHVDAMVGGKSALVVRDSIIYAFDPHKETRISEPKETSSTPSSFSLYQNYPNPFNPTTKIKYSIPSTLIPLLGGGRDGLVTLKVYDVLGREVATLVNESKQPGEYEVEFNSHSNKVQIFPSGVYFYQLKVGSFIQTKKMLLLK